MFNKKEIHSKKSNSDPNSGSINDKAPRSVNHHVIGKVMILVIRISPHGPPPLKDGLLTELVGSITE